jgi:hypothetical protein
MVTGAVRADTVPIALRKPDDDDAAGNSDPWHARTVLVSVHCPKCGARYETTIPATGVRRVGRCAACNRTGLEIVDAEESGAERSSEVPADERA